MVREVLLPERNITIFLEGSAGRMLDVQEALADRFAALLDRDGRESIGMRRKMMRHGTLA